jgi:hypothetical protein
MIISNLDHLEIVREDNNIEGGYANAYASGSARSDADSYGYYGYARTSAYLSVYTDTYSSYYSDSAYSSVYGSASSTSS